MFDTEIGKKVYNFSFIPFVLLSVVVIYFIQKNGKNVRLLINNKLEDDIQEIKTEIEILKHDIQKLK